MKEIITLVKGWVDDVSHLLLSFVTIGAVSEVIFGTGVFGVNVIGNLTSIINKFGESGFGLVLLVLVGLFRKYYRPTEKGEVIPPFFCPCHSIYIVIILIVKEK